MQQTKEENVLGIIQQENKWLRQAVTLKEVRLLVSWRQPIQKKIVSPIALDSTATNIAQFIKGDSGKTRD